MIRNFYLLIAFVLFTLCNYSIVSAHCDTMDGPVVGDAKKAIEQNNVNYVLKWVLPENEKEIKQAFELTMKVRGYGPNPERLADQYFFETLVRVHRTGEGMSYTGIKPSGTPINEKIIAADNPMGIIRIIFPDERFVFSTVFQEKSYEG
jgi:hypothetical protein